MTIRQKARQVYKLWRKNPLHPSLRFKRLKQSQPIYSVRIGQGYRALGVLRGNIVTWFWIGNHDKYEQLVRLKRL